MDNFRTRADRFKHGKALRRKTPRETHAQLKRLLSRDAVSILMQSDSERVPELVPERYARMTVNPFAFLRGAAAVMAMDLAGQPMAGIPVQAGGDCHLMNFGAFVTPENNILFDVNDFDETLPGVDFTVDLKRLAASVAVAALGLVADGIGGETQDLAGLDFNFGVDVRIGADGARDHAHGHALFGGLEADQVAHAVLFALSQPQSVEINEVVVRPVTRSG